MVAHFVTPGIMERLYGMLFFSERILVVKREFLRKKLLVFVQYCMFADLSAISIFTSVPLAFLKPTGCRVA